MRLTRLNFVELCAEAITATREKVTPGNQLSGYLKFHKEIKNCYVDDVLRPRKWKIAPDDPVQIHDLIEHTGLGYCHEMAQHLLVELAWRIDQAGGVAKISLVKSMKADHAYLEVRIYLAKERTLSMWEVDAWDPRIIDISKRPDGTVKNKEALEYGYLVKLGRSYYSDSIDYRKKFTFTETPPAKEGQPEGSCTPKHQVLEKHPYFYSDYSLKEAIEDKKLPLPGKIHFLQQISFWQKTSPEQPQSSTTQPKKMRLA
ncbi:hypothetical protein DIZ81_00045 [Legionella taurinensis]|uniref:Transglutaminase-like domain-containing protein n=1 Tax=Legionella taurinensis TaxID=70611 RepID=A0AB38NAT4_9GAMM|nr:hypothetical protein [Legionella taurinensis]MDX1836736.1 hypothetical protein [Legionella taurinensis]PUT42812.1 hypothetical protein DB744_00045 [Legionella taurinensis]PUT45367.1 hypothetical protein DB746_00045 [Legionella taurinensis]PUT47058.1 hypothetical protein DB743_03955 [Legionella taurinensis]PUT49134.1 hypothetical protein DB745_00045 [Legionella taurinensis]